MSRGPSPVLKTILLKLFAISLLAACGKSKETCQRESADLAAMFKAMDTRGGVPTRHVKLVRRDELELVPDESGVVLELAPEGASAWGVSEKPTEVRIVLDRMLQDWRSDEPPKLLLAIDAATPWRRVVNAFTTVEAKGFQDVALVFARKPIESKPPPRSAIDDQLEAIENEPAADRAVKVAELASELVRDCEAITTLFSGVAGGRPEDKAKVMIDGLPPALVACRCKCDVPSLKSLMYRLLLNRAPTTTMHVTLGGKALSLRGDLPWSEASQQLTPDLEFEAQVEVTR